MDVPVAAVVSLCVALVGGTVGAFKFFESQASAGEREDRIVARTTAGDVDSQLMAIEAELKLYRSIEERRELNADEKDRVEYLRKLRALLQEQRLKGGAAAE